MSPIERGVCPVRELKKRRAQISACQVWKIDCSGMINNPWAESKLSCNCFTPWFNRPRSKSTCSKTSRNKITSFWNQSRSQPPNRVRMEDSQTSKTRFAKTAPCIEIRSTKRKARKPFPSNFSSKLFAGKYGENWPWNRDNFVEYCNEWEITEFKFPYYLKETLKGTHLTSLKILLEMIRISRGTSYQRLSQTYMPM